MILTIQIDAPVSEAQAVKELLAMKVEGIGKVKLIRIEDDGYGRQVHMDTDCCGSLRTGSQ